LNYPALKGRVSGALNKREIHLSWWKIGALAATLLAAVGAVWLSRKSNPCSSFPFALPMPSYVPTLWIPPNLIPVSGPGPVAIPKVWQIIPFDQILPVIAGLAPDSFWAQMQKTIQIAMTAFKESVFPEIKRIGTSVAKSLQAGSLTLWEQKKQEGLVLWHGSAAAGKTGLIFLKNGALSMGGVLLNSGKFLTLKTLDLSVLLAKNTFWYLLAKLNQLSIAIAESGSEDDYERDTIVLGEKAISRSIQKIDDMDQWLKEKAKNASSLWLGHLFSSFFAKPSAPPSTPAFPRLACNHSNIPSVSAPTARLELDQPPNSSIAIPSNLKPPSLFPLPSPHTNNWWLRSIENVKNYILQGFTCLLNFLDGYFTE
jgi:hypothetical protein